MDIDLTLTTPSGQRVLHLLVLYMYFIGKVKIDCLIKLLRETPTFDVNFEDDYGKMALDIAVENRKYWISAILAHCPGTNLKDHIHRLQIIF